MDQRIHNLRTRRAGRSTPRPRLVTSFNYLVPLHRGMGGPQNRSGELGKISLLPGFEYLIIQPLAKPGTGYTIQVAISTYYKIPPLSAPSGSGSPHYRGFTITLRHTTVGRAPPDERSAPLRDLYLTTHNNHNRHTSMSPRDSNPQSQQASGRRPTL